MGAEHLRANALLKGFILTPPIVQSSSDASTLERKVSPSLTLTADLAPFMTQT